MEHISQLIFVVCLFGQLLLLNRESGDELGRQSKVQRKEERERDKHFAEQPQLFISL